ncbi:MAG: glycerol-3-phosphate dehydrogenase, partial [Chthoniobacteraceae bacterium]
GVETPIIDQVKAILDGSVSPADAMARLLGRDPTPE